jgi:hypothetical protein
MRKYQDLRLERSMECQQYETTVEERMEDQNVVLICNVQRCRCWLCKPTLRWKSEQKLRWASTQTQHLRVVDDRPKPDVRPERRKIRP